MKEFERPAAWLRRRLRWTARRGPPTRSSPAPHALLEGSHEGVALRLGGIDPGSGSDSDGRGTRLLQRLRSALLPEARLPSEVRTEDGGGSGLRLPVRRLLHDGPQPEVRRSLRTGLPWPRQEAHALEALLRTC